jgi:hypothetical protein
MGAIKITVMKKFILKLALALGVLLPTSGCDLDMDFTFDQPSANRWVSGVLTEKDSGKPIADMGVYAWKCTICFHDLSEEDCPEDYASAKTKEDGTFAFTYYGPSEFGFSYYHSPNPKYHHFSVNGRNRDSIIGPLCVNVRDSVFLNVKLW